MNEYCEHCEEVFPEEAWVCPNCMTGEDDSIIPLDFNPQYERRYEPDVLTDLSGFNLEDDEEYED